MLQLKIPPPIIGLFCAALLLGIDYLLPQWRFASFGLQILAALFVIAGLMVELISVSLFFKSKTTVNPLKPEKSQALVTSGLYRFSRNPMYLGMLLMLTGLTLWLGNPIGVLPLIIFVAYITTFQIKPEEAVLQRIFGTAYSHYQDSVRRWL